MKHVVRFTELAAVTLLGMAVTAQAQLLVNDFWRDGTRTDPGVPPYSEFGVDADADGDLESVWIAANRATNFVTAVGSLTFIPETGTSRAGLTYFAPSGSPVTLADGQALVVTLTFIPTGLSASNAATTTRFAVADYTGGTRLTADGTSSMMNGANVKAYGLFLNIANTFGTTPLSLRERTNLSSTELLGTATDWTTLSSGGGVAGDPGFVNGTPYTMKFTLARNSGQLDFSVSVVGGSLNISHSVTDPTPSTFVFDAFALRSTTAADTPTMQFRNFRVEVIPEPASIGLLGLGGLAVLLGRRRALARH
ncbi:MAG: PEP-CTERM sorting domain-containing protein [Verrucomicrobiae bacterium]|nr:PEP-CTERM sorting domain-containing protein [Verrucomicrobiae bacterium]